VAYSHLELAKAFLSTGELADALEALDAHMRELPDDDEARRLRIAARLRGDSESWRGVLADFYSLKTPTAEDYLYLAAALEKLGDEDGLLDSLARARETHPASDRLTERLLQALAARGDDAEALNLLRELPRTWRWRQWSGDLAAQRGEHDAASVFYSEALSLLEQQSGSMAREWAQPLQARLLLARGESLQAMGCLDEAEADYGAAQSLVPGDPMIPFKLGLLALLRGDVEAAERLCIDAYQGASEGLRDHMRQVLAGDTRYAVLRDRLSGS
jgi:Flp pilus assembly protein TadD